MYGNGNSQSNGLLQALLSGSGGLGEAPMQQMATPRNVTGIPQPYDPRAPQFREVADKLGQLAHNIEADGDTETATTLQRLMVDVKQLQNKRIQALIKRQEAQQKVSQLSRMTGTTSPGVM